MRRFCFRVLGWLIAGLLLASDSRTAVSDHPVAPGALSILTSGDLIILDSRRGLFRFNPSSRKVDQLVDGFGLFNAVDLVTASVEGTEWAFVTMIARSPLRARLVRYDLRGKAAGEWSLPWGRGWLSGVAIDSQALIAYVANAQSGEIYKFDLTKPRTSGMRLLDVPNARTLGPMVLDRTKHSLIIGDAAKGEVVAVDVVSKQSRSLVRNVGSTSALALDGGAGRLFIADSAGRRILRFDLNQGDSRPLNIGPTDVFREPLGLAFAGDGSLWVGDSAGGTVFLVSREGRILTSKKF